MIRFVRLMVIPVTLASALSGIDSWESYSFDKALPVHGPEISAEAVSKRLVSHGIGIEDGDRLWLIKQTDLLLVLAENTFDEDARELLGAIEEYVTNIITSTHSVSQNEIREIADLFERLRLERDGMAIKSFDDTDWAHPLYSLDAFGISLLRDLHLISPRFFKLNFPRATDRRSHIHHIIPTISRMGYSKVSRVNIIAIALASTEELEQYGNLVDLLRAQYDDLLSGEGIDGSLTYAPMYLIEVFSDYSAESILGQFDILRNMLSNTALKELAISMGHLKPSDLFALEGFPKYMFELATRFGEFDAALAHIVKIAKSTDGITTISGMILEEISSIEGIRSLAERVEVAESQPARPGAVAVKGIPELIRVNLIAEFQFPPELQPLLLKAIQEALHTEAIHDPIEIRALRIEAIVNDSALRLACHPDRFSRSSGLCISMLALEFAKEFHVKILTYAGVGATYLAKYAISQDDLFWYRKFITTLYHLPQAMLGNRHDIIREVLSGSYGPSIEHIARCSLALTRAYKRFRGLLLISYDYFKFIVAPRTVSGFLPSGLLTELTSGAGSEQGGQSLMQWIMDNEATLVVSNRALHELMHTNAFLVVNHIYPFSEQPIFAAELDPIVVAIDRVARSRRFAQIAKALGSRKRLDHGSASRLLIHFETLGQVMFTALATGRTSRESSDAFLQVVNSFFNLLNIIDVEEAVPDNRVLFIFDNVLEQLAKERPTPFLVQSLRSIIDIQRILNIAKNLNKSGVIDRIVTNVGVYVHTFWLFKPEERLSQAFPIMSAILDRMSALQSVQIYSTVNERDTKPLIILNQQLEAVNQALDAH